MSCDSVRAQLSPYLDGELAPAEAEAVAVHLAGCAACRGEQEGLAALITACRALPRAEPPHAEALWSRINAQLDEAPRSWRARLPWVGWRTWYWTPAVGALVATLLLVGTWSLRTRRTPEPVAPAPTPVAEFSDDALWRDAEASFEAAEMHYLRAIADLRRLAARDQATWPEDRRRGFDEALAQLDRATATCRAAARERHRDPEAQTVLYRAYREQISFLEDSLLRRAGAHP
jgi:anti-sigma factor RsiW